MSKNFIGLRFALELAKLLDLLPQFLTASAAPDIAIRRAPESSMHFCDVDITTAKLTSAVAHSKTKWRLTS